jgi:hypothetical protein
MPTSAARGVADLHQEPDENRAHKVDIAQVDIDGAGIAVDELSGRETERATVPQVDVTLDLHAVDKASRRSRDGQPHLILRIDRHVRPALEGLGTPEIRGGSAKGYFAYATLIPRSGRPTRSHARPRCLPRRSDLTSLRRRCRVAGSEGRLLEQPLFRLHGAVRTNVPVYGIGGFICYTETQLPEQLSHWALEQRIPRVEIKIGESRGADPGRDLDRMR